MTPIDRRIVCLLGAGLICMAPPAGANLFELVYQPQFDQDNDIIAPAWDQDGTHIKNMMIAASSIWDGIIEEELFGDAEIRIYFHWSDEPEDASASLYNSVIDPDTGRVTEATIQFRRTRDFWVDPTPMNHSEFALGQVLYRDVDPATRSFWYQGQVPDLLEVGFAGPRLNLDARDATNRDGNQGVRLGDTDSGWRDMLTLALHELGHALGVGPSANAEADLLEDAKYDVDPSLVNGANFEVIRNIAVDGQEDDDKHLFPESVEISPVLMAGAKLGEAPYFRRLPGQTDVIVMASVDDWSSVDLPRKEFISSDALAFWNDASNWILRRLPDDDDDVFVRNGSTAVLFDINPVVKNLLVDEASAVSVSGFDLTVLENLQVSATAEVTIGGGTLTADYFALNGELRGYGEVYLPTGSNQIAGFLGNIEAASDMTLQISGDFALTIEPSIDALEGDLRLSQDVTLLGHLRVGAGRLADVGQFEVDSLGRVTLDGTGTGLARIKTAGFESIELSGVIEVIADAQIDAPLTMNFGSALDVQGSLQLTKTWTMEGGQVDIDFPSTVSVGGISTLDGGVIDIANGSLIIFNGPVEHRGTSFTGDGEIHHNANALVSDDVTVTASVFDMDGSPDAANQFFTIAAGADFTLHADKIESTALVDGYDGTLTIRGRGAFHVASPWRLDGELVLNPNGPGAAELLGSKTIIEGKLTVGGHAAVIADIDFTPTSNVNVGPGAELDLRGSTTYNGGSFQNLGGAIKQTGDADVIGSTTIFAERFDLDGGTEDAVTTIVDGAKFSLHVDHLETSAVAERFDGRLNIAGELFVINEPDQWTMDGDLYFDDGVVSGSKVVVTGNVTGNGVFSSVVTNQGQIAPTPVDPDNSPGGLTFSAGLANEPGGVIRLEISGLTSNMHDQLNVLGDLTLRGGELDIVFVDGFEPSRGQTFDLITVGGSAIGDFQEINIVNLAEGFQFDTNLITAGGVAKYQLTAISNGRFLEDSAGDYNDDGVVDAADYVEWRDNVGAPPGTLANDIDGGPISHAQYETWRANFGKISGNGPVGTAVVPEPSALKILFLALCGGGWMRCRRAGRLCGRHR
jgi:hypothetical protein